MVSRTVPRNISSYRRGVMPQTFRSRNKYAQQDQLSCTAGVPARKTFSLNGLFDPDTALGGHQPMGFDQLMTFYDHYIVDYVTVSVTFMNTQSTSGNQGNFICGIGVTDSQSPSNYLSMTEILEQEDVQYCHIGPSNSGDMSKTVTLKLNPSKWLGRTRGTAIADSTLRGNSGSNPTEQVYLQVFAINTQSATSSNVIISVTDIKYYSRYFEPKALPQS